MDAIHLFISVHFELLVAVAMPVVAVAIIFGLLPLIITGERRGAAFIQDRPGPNRAAIVLPWLGRLRFFGLIQNLADMGKIFTKETFTPPFVHRAAYILAPAVFVIAILLGPAVLPWFGPIAHLGSDGVRTASGQALDADGGILVLFALGTLSVYGVVLAGWASNSKYSLLGGMRAAAVMISYEVSLGLSVMGMLLLVGDLSLTRVVAWQTEHTWGVFVQPVGFLLCLTAIFTECHRTPFDVVEGDSEIVGGFHTEYGSAKFMLFMAGEYLHLLLASALIVTLYLGGYSLLPFSLPLLGADQPWVSFDAAWISAHLGLVLAVVGVLSGAGAFIAAFLVARRRAAYAALAASDKAVRAREYTLFISGFLLKGLVLIAAGVAAYLYVAPEPLPGVMIEAKPVFPLWVGLCAAAVQLGVVLVKTLAVAWLFIWVRWTVPRFRYDQIMALGWKVMLNLAILNLVVTAVIAKLARGSP